MTRIELGGEGLPIPKEAMPDGLTDSGLSPLTFTYDANGNFDKTVWESFGYTIFEVMCVGAAGGRGSFAHFMQGGGTNAPEQYFTAGGAGGGGGLHIVAGFLADLDDISAIVVGQAGVERGRVQPGYSAWPISYNEHNIDTGLDGGDGGYSSFASTVCRASGGKGGKHSDVVIGVNTRQSGVWRPGGKGGAGGIGNSIVAGGGGVGGDYTLLSEGSSSGGGGSFPAVWDMLNAEDGVWDGVIGEGGGGGAGFTSGGGGVGSDAAWIPFNGAYVPVDLLSAHDMNSTDGGRGSFSYGDSTKYGPRQNKPTLTFPTNWNPYNVRNLNFSLPGSGGGARPTPLAKYGSYAAGYDPDGVVIVRIT